MNSKAVMSVVMSDATLSIEHQNEQQGMCAALQTTPLRVRRKHLAMFLIPRQPFAGPAATRALAKSPPCSIIGDIQDFGDQGSG